MRTKNLMLACFVLLLTLFACNDDIPNTKLEDFDSIKPDGWECEIIESNFNPTDIPQNTDTPIAIIKYTNTKNEFEYFAETVIHPSLILDIYPIGKKTELLDLIKSQQLFSWCIPIYFGETRDYFIITSPCFTNSGLFTEEANKSIADLYAALDKIIIKKE